MIKKYFPIKKWDKACPWPKPLTGNDCSKMEYIYLKN